MGSDPVLGSGGERRVLQSGRRSSPLATEPYPRAQVSVPLTTAQPLSRYHPEAPTRILGPTAPVPTPAPVPAFVPTQTRSAMRQRSPERAQPTPGYRTAPPARDPAISGVDPSRAGGDAPWSTLSAGAQAILEGLRVRRAQMAAAAAAAAAAAEAGGSSDVGPKAQAQERAAAQPAPNPQTSPRGDGADCEDCKRAQALGYVHLPHAHRFPRRSTPAAVGRTPSATRDHPDDRSMAPASRPPASRSRTPSRAVSTPRLRMRTPPLYEPVGDQTRAPTPVSRTAASPLRTPRAKSSGGGVTETDALLRRSVSRERGWPSAVSEQRRTASPPGTHPQTHAGARTPSRVEASSQRSYALENTAGSGYRLAGQTPVGHVSASASALGGDASSVMQAPNATVCACCC
jgi:hypothetical protein